MISSVLGWVAFFVALALPRACAQEIVLRMSGRLRPGFRVGLATRAAGVCAGTAGLWFLIPMWSMRYLAEHRIE